jgi:hypothetical protein
MNRGFLSGWALQRALLLVWLAIPALAQPGQAEITVEELLTKVAERAKEQNGKPPRREFIRTKTTVELDKKHKVKEREELTYRMVIVNGELYPRLILKNGRALSPKEHAKEEGKEAAFRNDQGKDAESDEGNTVLLRLNEETARRFDYTITGTELVNGRTAYVVTVVPKPDLPAKSIEEQVMAQMSGRLWIDEAEYEVARFEVHLMKPVQFGVVGVLGALHELDFSVFRSRQLEGDWENSLVKAWLQFRIFLETRRFQYEERISELPPGS